MQQQALQLSNAPSPGPTSIGGLVTLKSARDLIAEERAAAVQANSQPVVQGLASHIRKCWYQARFAKENTVEQRMLKSVRQRRGEYDPDKLALIKEQGGSLIYMMLTSNKCRAATSWMRDVLVTAAEGKPWAIEPSPVPELQPDVVQNIMQQATQQIMQMTQAAGGVPPPMEDVKQMLLVLKDEAHSKLLDIAQQDADRMDKKMQDQLLEGKWSDAFYAFLDDIVTFPSAFIKGPVVRMRPKLQWTPAQGGHYTLDVKDQLALEWERVDPFMIYPAPDCSGLEDGYLIERHRMQRADLVALLGVEGYSDGAIRGVLEDYGRGGLHDWIYVDVSKAQVEGKNTYSTGQNPSELIDALQFWGPVQGKILREWGMGEKEVPDELREYHVEAWLIGQWLIKATVNPDPLGRKPYYKASYEDVPGAFWGNSVCDLCRDTQDICNAAARALANNMGMASGPQVVYNVERLPLGENITHVFPWKIWQVTGDSQGGAGRPVDFFQPQTMAQELMQVYEKFSVLADEYTGIPRYMTGDSPTGGAGRTASGMSMLMSNAGKSIKQVIAGIDQHVIKPCIDRLYYYNMRYSDDPDLKGDVNIISRGAAALMVKEQAQVRRNEFLAATANPIDMQIVGMEGRAAILREAVKSLDMNPDDIIPPLPILRQRLAAQQAAQQAQLAAQTNQPSEQIQIHRGPDGAVHGASVIPNRGAPQHTLQNGAPITNNFPPVAKP